MNNRLRLLFFVCYSLFGIELFAQIPNDFGYQDYKDRFPKESFIYLNLEYYDEFDIKNEKLEVSLGYREQLLYLNNNAFQLSQRTVGYDQFTQIKHLEAICFYPIEGKYKKEKVKHFEDEEPISDGISFYDESKQRKFRYENLKEGSVTNLEYDVSLNEPRLLRRRAFYRGLYKAKQSYTIKVHEDIDLGFKTFSIDKEDIQFTEWNEGKYKYYKWELSNQEKFSIHGDEDNELYITPQVIPYIKNYTINGIEKPIFRNLDDLYAWYASLIEKVNPISDKRLKSLADSITVGAVSEVEKVQRIYYWVQDQIKYIAFGDGYGGFIPRDPDNIYEKRFGDCKDMSCLTINLLEELDINAYFTWVGTRDIPYGYSELFTPQVDNHMIATYYDSDGKAYYLDATDPNLLFGRPSAFIQGKEVLVGIDDTMYRKDTVPILSAYETKEIDTVYMEIKDKKIIGKGAFSFSGYLAEEVYSDFERIPDEELIKNFNGSLAKGSNKFSASNVKYYRPNESKDTTIIDYDFEIEDYTNQIDDNLYLNMNLTKQFKEFKINEKLNVPIIFDFKYFLRKEFTLKIPNGFKAEFIPEDVVFESKLIDYSIKYLIIDNHIKYLLTFKQDIIQLDPSQVSEWNKYIAKLSNHLDESIKLIKIQHEN